MMTLALVRTGRAGYDQQPGQHNYRYTQITFAKSIHDLPPLRWSHEFSPANPSTSTHTTQKIIPCPAKPDVLLKLQVRQFDRRQLQKNKIGKAKKAITERRRALAHTDLGMGRRASSPA
jgi:hypothetical protein